MVTVSHIVKKIVSGQPFVEEALSNGIINIANLAEKTLPKVEQELGKKVKLPAVAMALRRYADEISRHRMQSKKFDYSGELIIKTNVCDFTIAKTTSLMSKLRTIHNIANLERGDTLNVIIGNNEVSIIISEKHEARLKSFLLGEKILNKDKDLVSLTMIFKSEAFTHTPGVIFNIVRKLAWENINIYEIVSTMTELTFILSKKDSMKAYDVLHQTVSNIN